MDNVCLFSQRFIFNKREKQKKIRCSYIAFFSKTPFNLLLFVFFTSYAIKKTENYQKNKNLT